MFKIIKKDNRTNARLGVLSTPHGKIETPSYVIVATHAEVKCLKPSDIKKTKTQVVICNTYHLWNKALKIKNSKLKIQGILGAKIPVMTDSGGFQVFSLGFGMDNKIGKILKPVDKRLAKSFIHRRENVKITDQGVCFKWRSPTPSTSGGLQGTWKFLSPEISMQIQKKLGADIIFAFDECTSPLDGFDYNKKALERTHAWAQASLKFKVKSEKLSGKRQFLFGIVQGGRFKSLRIKSAKYIASLPFDGIGIGGSFGKDEMIKTIKWVIPHLPKEKPRHLLGIGKIADIFNAVEQGIDLLDCVIPTREARHGRIYTKTGHFDISKFPRPRFSSAEGGRNIDTPLERGCKCPTCLSGMTRVRLRELFKSAQLIRQARGKRYATIHNIWFFNNLLEEIRKSIKIGKFKQLKNRLLKQFEF